MKISKDIVKINEAKAVIPNMIWVYGNMVIDYIKNHEER